MWQCCCSGCCIRSRAPSAYRHFCISIHEDRAMITIQHEGNLTVIGIFATFEIEDFRRLETEVEKQLRDLGQIDLLVDLLAMLDYTLDAALEDIRFSREHALEVGRIAILSEDDAVVWTAMLSRIFVRAEIQVFDNEALAREWLE